ncbi:MAG: ribonuclease E/G [Acetobacteraceae bacterium]
MILVAASPGELRAALRDAEGRLADFAISRPAAPDGIGDLYRGRIGRRVPSMGGTFVLIETERYGFLPDTIGAAGLTEGARVTVRVTRAAQGGKGPRLALAGMQAEGPVGLLSRGPDAVRRLAARWPELPLLIDDPAVQAQLAAALPGRVRSGPGFDEALEAEIAGLAEAQHALPGGAVAHIEITRALVAIDVDSGMAAASPHPAMNQAVIPELARQIRLRNLGGAILIDLAGLSVRRRKALAPDFVAALARDPLRPRFLGFTALGLAEILRPRVAPPLYELLFGPYAAGLAALRAVAKESRAAPARIFALRAAPSVAGALAGDPAALAELARRTGRVLTLESDPSLAPVGWALQPLA